MKRSTATVAALTTLCLMLGLGACGEKIRPSVLQGFDAKHSPQQESWHSTVLISDSGNVEAKIVAGYIQKFDSPQETKLDSGVTVYFYDERGKQTTILRARNGTVNELTYDIVALGNVVVVSDDSTRLRSERLFWDNKRRLIHTPDEVSIVSSREKVQGLGFESDQRLRNYRIFKVKAQVRSD